MQKGQPSLNPRGRGVSKVDWNASGSGDNFGPTAPTPGPTKASGSDAVAVYGGFLFGNERRRDLSGREKWVTYDNMTLNVAIVAAAMGVWTQLGGSAKWTAEPNARGGKDGQRAADLVTEGLLEAQMSKPWRQVVRRQIVKKFRGFAMHEALIRRRPDGKIVFGDLQHRPQWSVFRWNKPNEQSPWIGVEQLTRTGGRFYVPRERLFYSVEDTLSDSPDGIGALRQLAEPARVLQLYQDWEGIGFQTDLRGVPLAKAPLAALANQARAAGAVSASDIKAYITAQTQFLTDFLDGHAKSSDQGIMLPSEPYRSLDAGQTPSSVLQWSFELVKGATSSMPEVGIAIGRLTREIARVMCAEWLLLGGDDSGGAYSMHEDKTAMFGLLVNSTLGDVADDATRDLAARLVALNGMDPETCTPRLVVEPIAAGSVEVACRSLMLLAQSGLHPQDKARDVLRGRMDLPAAPAVDESEWMLPRGTELAPEGGGIVGAKPPSRPAPAGTPGTPGASMPPTKPGAPEAPPAVDGKPGNVNADTGKKRRRSR